MGYINHLSNVAVCVWYVCFHCTVINDIKEEKFVMNTCMCNEVNICNGLFSHCVTRQVAASIFVSNVLKSSRL